MTKSNKPKPGVGENPGSAGSGGSSTLPEADAANPVGAVPAPGKCEIRWRDTTTPRIPYPIPASDRQRLIVAGKICISARPEINLRSTEADHLMTHKQLDSVIGSIRSAHGVAP